MFVYTIQPVVKAVVKLVWQPPVVSCIQTFNRLTTVLNEQSVRSTRLSNRLSNGFDNRFDNRLYRVNGVWE